MTPKQFPEDVLHLTITRTVPYELGMLIETFRLLQVRAIAGTPLGDIINNALIKSFCIHARNLHEFFACKRHVTACHFTKAYQPAGLTRDHVLKLNNQIAHIGQGRTADTSLKINGNDRKVMLQKILAQRRIFVGCLEDRWKPKTQELPCFADGWPDRS